VGAGSFEPFVTIILRDRPDAAADTIAGGLRMKLDCYRIHADAPQLVPARPGRAWMVATGTASPIDARR